MVDVRRTGRGWFGICLSLALASGCSKAPETVTVTPPTADRFAKWPADTIERPEFVGVVDREAGRVAGDAEPARVPAKYQMPDWAEPTSTISMRGPKGARLTFHLLPRIESLRKGDDARIAALLKGQKVDGATLVVARPWIGWFGQAGGDRTLRIYTLFANNRQLEIHLDWTNGDKNAYDEAVSLLAHLVYSLQPMGA